MRAADCTVPTSGTSREIRRVVLDGRPGILGADLRKVLGIATPGVFYARLAADEMGYVSRTDIGLPAGKPMIVVFESGVNKAILRSNKPEARPFQEWA